MRESVKKHDIHIKPKSYKLEFLGKFFFFFFFFFGWIILSFKRVGRLTFVLDNLEGEE